MKLSGFFILCVSLYSHKFGSMAWAQNNAASVDQTSVQVVLPNKSSGDISENLPVLDVVQDIKVEKKTSSKKEVFFKCSRGQEMRWIRINYMKNGKCKTTYSREGDAKDVSMAEAYETCENVLNNIKKNLEAGGYLCEEKILMGALNLE